jgi:hypothetical protein
MELTKEEAHEILGHMKIKGFDAVMGASNSFKDITDTVFLQLYDTYRKVTKDIREYLKTREVDGLSDSVKTLQADYYALLDITDLHDRKQAATVLFYSITRALSNDGLTESDKIKLADLRKHLFLQYIKS